VNHRRLLKSFNFDAGYGWVLLGTELLLLLPLLAGEAGRRQLRYERSGLAAGELWRLVTAHVVHLDLRHALLNGLGLALLWVLFARAYSARGWLAIAAASIAAIDAGLWWWNSTIDWYVGSSGALHGILAAGVVAQLRSGDWRGWILLTVIAGKLAYEHAAGPLPFAGNDPVVVAAHLYGAAGGMLAAVFLRPRSVPL